MKNIAGVFAVSFIAIIAVASVRAEVVSTELLDKRLATTGNLAAVAHTGSYNDLSGKPTIPDAANNATLTIQKNGTAVGTFTANASDNKTINITVPTGSLASKNTVTSADITNGTITTDDISATAGITKTQLAAAVQTSLGKADTALQAASITGKEDKSNKVKSTTDWGTMAASDDAYPSMATAQAMATAAAGQVNNKLGDLATEDMVSTSLIEDKAVTEAKLSDTVNASLDKADTALQPASITGKEDKANKTATIAAAASANDTKYPTEKAVRTELDKKQGTLSANQINATNSGITSAKVSTYDGYATTIGNKQDKSTAVTHTANTAAGSATVPVYVNSSGVATAITSYSGNAATATTATNAKKICSGSTCTAFVDIWVE